MTYCLKPAVLIGVLTAFTVTVAAHAQEKAIVGLIPKSSKPASFAAATAGHEWIAPSSIPVPLRLEVRLLSGGCNWLRRLTQAP